MVFFFPQQYVNKIYWPFEVFNVMWAASSVSGHRTLRRLLAFSSVECVVGYGREQQGLEIL